MEIVIGYASTCRAMRSNAIGTKILCLPAFEDAVRCAIARNAFGTERERWHGTLLCPEAIPFVSAGVGRRMSDCGDYVVRMHRGKADLFLKRRYAARVEACSVVVYTREAYLVNSEVRGDPAERERIHCSRFTHIIVEVFATAGPVAPLSPDILVYSLACKNELSLTWSADEIRARAAESKAYWDKWCVVADELSF
jgi:hypothetical protein